MRRCVAVVAMMGLSLLAASGVAYAATITCPNRDGRFCVGTDRADVIRGSNVRDEIRARAGNDVVAGVESADKLTGGLGADTLDGGTGKDLMIGSATKLKNPNQANPLIERFTDSSSDRLDGDASDDVFFAGFAQGGVDRVEGGGGDDEIYASAREFRGFYEEIEVTKELIQCGPGDDFVQYDAGVDVVDRESCERLDPVTAGEDTGSRSSADGNDGLYMVDLD